VFKVGKLGEKNFRFVFWKIIFVCSTLFKQTDTSAGFVENNCFTNCPAPCVCDDKPSSCDAGSRTTTTTTTTVAAPTTTKTTTTTTKTTTTTTKNGVTPTTKPINDTPTTNSDQQPTTTKSGETTDNVVTVDSPAIYASKTNIETTTSTVCRVDAKRKAMQF
jgi:hypothetical protein